MSRLPDGREVLVTLALPLSLRLVGELSRGIQEAAGRAGFTDVELLLDGTNRVVARRTEDADQ